MKITKKCISCGKRTKKKYRLCGFYYCKDHYYKKCEYQKTGPYLDLSKAHPIDYTYFGIVSIASKKEKPLIKRIKKKKVNDNGKY